MKLSSLSQICVPNFLCFFFGFRKVDQIVYDVRHVEASYRNYMQKKKQKVC